MPEFQCCIDPCDSYSGNDPFQATLLWEKIVLHLERTVKSSRHTLGLRTFENCFHGSKAVDCLVLYLNTILPKTIQRSQAVVLCQKLLESGVMQQIKGKKEFCEKGLHRFTYNHFWEPPILSRTIGKFDSDRHGNVSPQTQLARSNSMGIIIQSEETKNKAKLTKAHESSHKGYASDSSVTLSTHHKNKIKSGKVSATRKEGVHSPLCTKKTDFVMFTKNKVQSVTRLFQSGKFRAPHCSASVYPSLKVKLAERRKKLCGEQKEVHTLHKLESHFVLPTKVYRSLSLSKPSKPELPKCKMSNDETFHFRKEAVHAAAIGTIRQESNKVKRVKKSLKPQEIDVAAQNCLQIDSYINCSNVYAASSGCAAINTAAMNKSHSFSSQGDLVEHCSINDGQVRLSGVCTGTWTIYGFL